MLFNIYSLIYIRHHVLLIYIYRFFFTLNFSQKRQPPSCKNSHFSGGCEGRAVWGQMMNQLKMVISCDKSVKDVNHLVCSREEIYLNSLFRESACVFVAQSCPTLQPHELQPTRLLCPRNSPGTNTGMGCHSLLQGIFPTQGLNPGLLHCNRFFPV